jgi:energy-coupling factor transporter ATP-binding protein EcfA2
MLKSLELENFTVFPVAHLSFGKNLNVFVGENGSGKTHILKAIYSAIAANSERRAGQDVPGKAELQPALANKLMGVFRPDGLGRLVRRARGRGKCGLRYEFDDPALNLEVTFSTLAKTEVTVKTLPTRRVDKLPV